MKMTVVSRPLEGIAVLQPEVFQDERGFFLEAYRQDQFRELGLPGQFVQENHSGSVRGVLRGLHFQWDPPMGKLMRVTRGAAYLVAVDIRKGSPTLGRWFGIEVTAESRMQVWAPAGFARGFCVLSEFAEIQYKCTGIYSSACESGIRWDDPAIGIAWPVKEPTLSAKDRDAQTLEQWLARPQANAFTF
jgi:dTDP-4-dehydrorhamnose 3,5-epimerase